jgi:hypothetical protein
MAFVHIVAANARIKQLSSTPACRAREGEREGDMEREDV